MPAEMSKPLTIICWVLLVSGIIAIGAIVSLHSDEQQNTDVDGTTDGDNPFITDVVTFEGYEGAKTMDREHKHHMSTICSSDVDKAIAYIDSHNGVVVSVTGYSYKRSYDDAILIAWNEY